MRKLALTMTCTTCVFSAFGVFARWLQNMTAFEENGLYIPGSLWGIVLTLLYIAGAAVFFGFTRYYKKNLSLACAPDPGIAFAGSGLLPKLIYLAVALIMAAGSVMLLITAGDAEAPLGMDFSGLLRILALLGLLAAGGFYMVCIYSFGTILDWHEFVKSPVPALACLKGINMLLYLAMLVIATLGPMGPMNSFYGATSRIMLAMGRKGQLPEQFAEVDPKSGAPKLACVVLGVITVVGPFLGKNMLIPLTNVSALAFIFSCGMVALACLRMRFTEPDLPRPYEVPGGKFGIGLAIAACAIIIGLLVIPFSPASLNMVEWSIVIGWLAIGLALMAFTNSRKK